jgi:hypothetical protein
MWARCAALRDAGPSKFETTPPEPSAVCGQAGSVVPDRDL